jgi:hypothetical protein
MAAACRLETRADLARRAALERDEVQVRVRRVVYAAVGAL